MSVLDALAAALRAEGGLVADALADLSGAEAHLGSAAAAGPRAAGRGDDYALLVEAIAEGYLLHYDSGRVVRSDDPDLELLAGDRLYALGLSRLAELGDLEAVAELADVISLAAQARAEGDADRAEAVWAAGVTAVGHGGGPELEAAKGAARAGSGAALRALRQGR